MAGPEKGDFAWNDLQHDDPQGCDHEQFGPGLSKALYNYMHGLFLDAPLHTWFAFPVPRTTHSKTLISKALEAPVKSDFARPNSRLVWLGNAPELEYTMGKKGRMAMLRFYEKTEDLEVKLAPVLGEWLFSQFSRFLPESEQPILMKELAETFPAQAGIAFVDFLQGGSWKMLREKGLVLV